MSAGPKSRTRAKPIFLTEIRFFVQNAFMMNMDPARKSSHEFCRLCDTSHHPLDDESCDRVRSKREDRKAQERLWGTIAEMSEQWKGKE